ncbi:MAG TPA: selenide, water dikinase SelD [Spirochaetes bacterium]|nr:selenide, water dikinase SelD [Spirochaetota bacterium]
MKDLSIPYDDRVIVGMGNSDDAGVYRLTDDIALIQTLDFFTPIVDDPYTFGRIAVVNGLSDVYAMGGEPLTAMNIVAFPVSKFSLDILTKILEGGLSVLKEAGVQLLGGHSVEDDELKYGVSVTGTVRPERVLRNRGLLNGDAIVLTKPLGTGIIGTVLKGGAVESAEYDVFVETMVTLNAAAGRVMRGYEVHACTDVTGFGLMGHLSEMLAGDKLRVSVDTARLPLLPGAAMYASMGMIPAGLYRNQDYVGALCETAEGVRRELSDLVFDPQTSGGLLIALPAAKADGLVDDLVRTGLTHARVIARVETHDRPSLVLE